MTVTVKISKTQLSKAQAAEERLKRAYAAAHKAAGLGTFSQTAATVSPQTATILAALITIYKE